MQINESFRKLIPPLSSEEYAQLEENCKADGIRDPLVVWRGTLIDGHNRYDIAQKHGLDYTVVEKEFEDENHVKIWMIRNQKGRRNLTDGWKYMLAEAEKTIQTEIGAAVRKATEGRPKQAEIVDGNQEKLLSIIDNSLTENPSDIMEKQKHNTREKIAESLGWSTGKVAMADRVFKSEKPEIKAAVLSGEKSINEAYKEIRATEKKEERIELITQQIEDIESGKLPELQGLYSVVSIDPPWNYEGEKSNSYDANGRRVANPYPEMPTEEIKKIELPLLPDAVVLLWTTHKFLPDAFDILKAWGLQYKATMVWNKEKIGMGAWLRMQCEFCLVGIRGNPFWENTLHRDIITEPRREHSRKPDKFFTIIEEITKGRKLEYFSREKRENWDVFGNDIERF